MKIVSSECFRQSSSAKVVEASFEIFHMSDNEKKSQNIDETSLNHMIKAVTIALGETNSKKLAKISLSDSAIKHASFSSHRMLSFKFS